MPHCPHKIHPGFSEQRIIESLHFEKTSKITQPSHPPAASTGFWSSELRPPRAVEAFAVPHVGVQPHAIPAQTDQETDGTF